MSLLASIVSAVVAAIALFFTWRKWREDVLRRGDVFAWANEAIGQLESLLLVCLLKEPLLDATLATEKLKEVAFETSILVERGRLFFKNQIVDDHGREKEPAYRGYRPRILDPLVVAHEVACGWMGADEDTRLRMSVIADDQLKKFVSLAQKEVGRSRTASADTGQGGDGLHLRHLLAEVDGARPERLRRAVSGLGRPSDT